MDGIITKPLDLRTSGSSGSVAQAAGPHAAFDQNKPAITAATSLPTDMESRRPVNQVNAAERDELEDAVADMREFVQSVSRDINFQLDGSSGQVVVKVTDRASGDVIRQLPSEEALRLAESLANVRSLLFEAKA